MRFTTTDGEQVWINPARIDSMKETTNGDGEKIVRVRCYGDTFVATDSFDELAERLDGERNPKQRDKSQGNQ